MFRMVRCYPGLSISNAFDGVVISTCASPLCLERSIPSRIEVENGVEPGQLEDARGGWVRFDDKQRAVALAETSQGTQEHPECCRIKKGNRCEIDDECGGAPLLDQLPEREAEVGGGERVYLTTDRDHPYAPDLLDGRRHRDPARVGPSPRGRSTRPPAPLPPELNAAIPRP